MQNKKTIEAIMDFIDAAEKSVKNAKKLLKGMVNENNINLEKTVDLETDGLSSYTSDAAKIIEGVFTGSDMLGVDKVKYPVPVNYASKSKLVQGDKLKLTIEESGRMIYKQIEPIEREFKKGRVVKEKEKYQVVIESETYDLLTAAVTHFKVNIGDKITVIIPANKKATFAAIEAVI